MSIKIDKLIFALEGEVTIPGKQTVSVIVELLFGGDFVGGEMVSCRDDRKNPSERLKQATQVLKINLSSRSNSLGLKDTKLETNSTSILQALLKLINNSLRKYKGN